MLFFTLLNLDHESSKKMYHAIWRKNSWLCNFYLDIQTWGLLCFYPKIKKLYIELSNLFKVHYSNLYRICTCIWENAAFCYILYSKSLIYLYLLFVFVVIDGVKLQSLEAKVGQCRNCYRDDNRWEYLNKFFFLCVFY